MKLIPTDKVPEVKRNYNKLQDMIEEFVNGPYEVVKVQLNENEYKSVETCTSSLRVAVKRSRYSVKVFKRGNDVYLSK